MFAQVRVRSLQFHYFPLIQHEEKLGWEIQTINEGEELPILNHHAVTGIVSRSCSI